MSEEPKLWTTDEVRTVAQLLYGHGWQTQLASAIEVATKRTFSQSRVAKWFLPEGGRGIPAWLQPELTGILRGVATMVEYAVNSARKIIQAHYSEDQAMTESDQQLLNYHVLLRGRVFAATTPAELAAALNRQAEGNAMIGMTLGASGKMVFTRAGHEPKTAPSFTAMRKAVLAAIDEDAEKDWLSVA